MRRFLKWFVPMVISWVIGGLCLKAGVGPNGMNFLSNYGQPSDLGNPPQHLSNTPLTIIGAVLVVVPILVLFVLFLVWLNGMWNHALGGTFPGTFPKYAKKAIAKQQADFERQYGRPMTYDELNAWWEQYQHAGRAKLVGLGIGIALTDHWSHVAKGNQR